MKRIFIFILSGVMFLFGTYPSDEVEAQSSDEGVGFSVQAILPENQRETGVTYFDLLVEPDESQTLRVEIFNHEDTPLEVQVTPTTSSTNRNGLIVYEPQEEFDESLEYPISELVELDANTVIVPANNSQIVDVHLDIPEDPFEGYLLGGLHFEKVLTEEEENNEGVQIQNRYAYLIGLQVTEDEQQMEFNLELRDIVPTLVNYRTAVVAKIQNDQPNIMSDVIISAEVYEAGGEEPIKTAMMENVQFAPNSTMDFVIDWENQYLEPGDYQLKLLATSGEYEWEWDESFSITDKQAQISDEAVEIEQFSWMTPQLLLTVVILLIIIIFILLYRLNKKN